MKDDRLYLLHIQECAARIEEYVGGGRQAFLESRLIQDAVLRNLQVLAESTQRLSDAAKARHPEVDWRAIVGFGNVLVHDYLGVDAAAIWKIVRSDLPVLKEAVAEMVADSGPAPGSGGPPGGT
jgi:uncharacterized protein with HEPN domain